MRKLLLLTPFLLLNIGYANTNATTCIQISQSAVSPAGECKEYATPCDVPDDYKVVPSCDIVKKRNFGISLEQRMKKRFAFRQKRQIKKRNNTKRATHSRRGFGQSAGSGYKRTRVIRTEADKSKVGIRKMRTQRNYSKTARELAKSLNPNRGRYQQTISKKRTKRRTHKRKIRSSVTKDLRKKLSNRPTWSTETNRRSKILNYSKNWENSHLSEERKKIRNARKKQIHKEVKLQKTWKGGRIEGSLTR